MILAHGPIMPKKAATMRLEGRCGSGRKSSLRAAKKRVEPIPVRL